MKSIEVKGTARTIAERSSEQARALKAIRKDNGVPCVLYSREGSRTIRSYWSPMRSRYLKASSA